jgi:phasin family protein
MSETKSNDAVKKASDQTVRSTQASIDTASRVTKESVGEAAQAVQNGTDRAKEVAQGVTETVAETANAAANLSSKAAEQSREVMMMGVRTAAGVGSRVAELSFDRGHHFVSSAAHAMEVYRDASERSAERVQALFSSYMTFGRGLQTMQHAWLEMVNHTMEQAAHKPQDLLRSKNAVELAEVQRDLYIDAVNHAIESTSRLLEIASRTAQDAVRPLKSHAH